MKRMLLVLALLAPTPCLADPPAPAAPDFVQQRKDLLQKADFDPMAMEETERAAIAKSYKDWKEGHPDQAIDDIFQAQKKYPASLPLIRSQAELSEAWADRAQKPESKDLFRKTGQRLREIEADLLRSITASADGKTEKTAWVVLDVAEEYEVLHHLQLKPQSQGLVNDPASGKAYDRFELLDEAGAKSVAFFDITKFWDAETRLFSGKEGKDKASSGSLAPAADAGGK